METRWQREEEQEASRATQVKRREDQAECSQLGKPWLSISALPFFLLLPSFQVFIHQAFIINYIQFKISRPLYQVLGVSVWWRPQMCRSIWQQATSPHSSIIVWPRLFSWQVAPANTYLLYHHHQWAGRSQSQTVAMLQRELTCPGLSQLCAGKFARKVTSSTLTNSTLTIITLVIMLFIITMTMTWLPCS